MMDIPGMVAAVDIANRVIAEHRQKEEAMQKAKAGRRG